MLKNIEDKALIVSKLFKEFKEKQAIIETKYIDIKNTKEEVQKRLAELNDLLNKYKAYEYGIDTDDLIQQKKYTEWLKSHNPFHWFSEFYEIINNNKGFNVIIGNPPYVEYSSVKQNYSVLNYKTFSAGNLYAYIIERSLKLQNVFSYNGMIIPLSAYCTDRMDVFQSYEVKSCPNIWLSNYAERPSKLFQGAERNLTIAILLKESRKRDINIFTTSYYKWSSSIRCNLFDNISYIDSTSTKTYGIIPKVSTKLEMSILKIHRMTNKKISNHISIYPNNNILYYRNSGGRYWKIITDFQPKFYLNGKRDVSSRESYLFFESKDILKLSVSVLNSTLYYWYYIMHSDARTNNPSDLKEYPIDYSLFSGESKAKLLKLCDTLMNDLNKNSVMQLANYRTGKVKFQQFFTQFSKPIIDEIDKVLANHYGFTEEELDFIINYDIKYRMGKELEEEE